MEPKILAASPAFGGPGTRPYRIVLRQLKDGSFAVHAMYLDVIGGYDSGSYYAKGDYHAAMVRWSRRTESEIIERDDRCWVFTPIGEEASLPQSKELGPCLTSRCPQCNNSLDNGTPHGSPNLRRCADCKLVFVKHPDEVN